MLIGVDGGNTKTVALVATPDGTVIGRGRSGCSDIHNAPSVEVALDAMAAACQDALFEAGIAASDVTAACFNLAGADWPEDFDLLRRTIPELVGLPQEPLVVNDAIAPIRAGTADGAGVSVVCGTFGTTAARNLAGDTYHVGFWPDQTGARGLGRDGLAAVWRSELGLGPETALTGRSLELYGTATPMELLHSFTRRGGWPEQDKERLAPVVLEEATAADPVAGEIVANHGRILGGAGRACADAVGLLGNGRFPVVLTGGVFHNPSAVLSDAILANVPEGDAVAAAARARDRRTAAGLRHGGHTPGPGADRRGGARLMLEAASQPLYYRVYRMIADDIASGTLRPGDRLPAERELCQQLSVSRTTVRRAFAALVEDGLIESAAGRGAFVTNDSLAEPPNVLMSFSELGASRGLRATSVVLTRELRQATIEQAELFHIAPGAAGVRARAAAQARRRAGRRRRGGGAAPPRARARVRGLRRRVAVRRPRPQRLRADARGLHRRGGRRLAARRRSCWD